MKNVVEWQWQLWRAIREAQLHVTTPSGRPILLKNSNNYFWQFNSIPSWSPESARCSWRHWDISVKCSEIFFFNNFLCQMEQSKLLTDKMRQDECVSSGSIWKPSRGKGCSISFPTKRTTYIIRDHSISTRKKMVLSNFPVTPVKWEKRNTPESIPN